MKTVIIVQARMTSTRLPGKVLKEVLGKPLLEYQIERLRRVKLADGIVIATTVNETDLPIVQLCEKLNIAYFRGSEEDVLSRYYYAAVQYQADAVVRITSDCPIIDPRLVDEVIALYRNNYPQFDYVSNVGKRTFPRGMDTEVFSFQALQEAHREATLPEDREHVTPFIRRNTERHKAANLRYPEDQSAHRWTVDTPEDFALIEKIIVALADCRPEFTLEDCLRLLRENPEWSSINEAIKQKES